MSVLIDFLPGDGTRVEVEVAYLADFPCNTRGFCAFCNADPCAEGNDETTLIAQYFARNPRAQACPMCDGRPS